MAEPLKPEKTEEETRSDVPQTEPRNVPHLYRLDGKVAVVTGAGSGIGKAAARLLSQQGARVGLLDHSEDELRKVEQEVKDAGGDGLPLVADVSDPQAVQAAMDRTYATWGRVDIVFANAGINGVWAPLEELTPEDWDQTMRVNLYGTFYTVKYALPYLKAQGGSVIITSSINGTRVFSNTGATAYSSTKAGQVAFAKMVALELAKHRIRVNVICPGWIKTEIGKNTEQRNLEKVREPAEYPEGEIPLTDGNAGAASQVAQLVLFLAADASSHITGTEVWIDGGESLLIG